MFAYVDLRKIAEPTKNKEMSCLNELSQMMDQFVDLAKKAHLYLCESSKPKQNHWNMFKVAQTPLNINPIQPKAAAG